MQDGKKDKKNLQLTWTTAVPQKDDESGLVRLELEVLDHGRLLARLGHWLDLLGLGGLPRLPLLSQRHFLFVGEVDEGHVNY